MNILSAVDTADLIAELTRRKRIFVLHQSANYFNKFAEDEGYMRSLDMDIVRTIGRVLNNKLYIAFEDAPLEHDSENRPTRTMRKASVMVLAPEGVDCEAD
jgi:hypothetical protein